MKKFVIAGTLVSALALSGIAFAQSTAPAAQQPAAGATKQGTTKQSGTKPAPPTTAGATAEQPAAAGDQKTAAAPKKARTRSHAAAGENASGTHTAPKAQPGTTGDANAADTALALGTVKLPGGLKADGKALPAGSYSVHLTPDEAKPDAKGATEKLERWVEFRKGTNVVGREVVSIVPADEAKLVQKDTPPPSGGHKVETLKGGDYVRLWINKGGTYYLVHLAKG